MATSGKARGNGLLRRPDAQLTALARRAEAAQSHSLPSLRYRSTQTPPRTARLGSEAAADLALDRIVHALAPASRYERTVRELLSDLCRDPADILYRQDILADLLAAPHLAGSLRAVLPMLAVLATRSRGAWKGDSPLMAVIERLGELDTYVRCIDTLRRELAEAEGVRSAGLVALRDAIAAVADDPEVSALRAELPAMHDLVAETTSVTIGLNLGAGLQPESATILALDRQQFRGPRSLLGRLLPGGAERGGRTPLREVGPVTLRRGSQLFRDLQDLLESATAPLVKALDRYREVNVAPLVALEGDLAFYIGAAALAARLRDAGIAVCRPEIAPMEERVLMAEDLANLALGLRLAGSREDLIANPASFDAECRVLILTGPNRGGKTTYCRAIGHAQVLFQAGLFVPAAAARLSPADTVLTHFPLPEADHPGAGRLDEELQRLRGIFERATRHSLVLLNEPLTSTSERGALHIAMDVVRALRILGGRVLLVTHLHELATAIPELNSSDASSGGVRSLVAEATADGNLVRGTFRIVAAMPAGRSYASEIARQHGVTFDQLNNLIEERDRGGRSAAS